MAAVGFLEEGVWKMLSDESAAVTRRGAPRAVTRIPGMCETNTARLERCV